jgi:hypothetical protein
MFVIAKNKSKTLHGKENRRLDLGVKNLWKIYKLAYVFLPQGKG